MSNTPTTQPANPPADQSDDATQVIAIQGDDVVAVNFPALPLIQKEREAEIRTILGNSRPNSDGGAPPSPEITALSQDLQLTPETDKVWRYLNPNDKAELDLIVATLLGEAPFDKTAVNEIALRSDGTVLAADFDETRSRLYYENGDSPLNYVFPDRRSQIRNHALNLYGTAFAALSPVMLVHFDYALDDSLNNGQIVDLVKFGDAHPIVQLVGGRGLVLNCANERPGETTTTTVRNILRPIHSANTYYRIAVSPEEVAAGGVAYDDLYFYVPPSVGTGVGIKLNVQIKPDGHLAGVAGYTYYIRDRAVDQTMGTNHVFDAAGYPGLLVNVFYVADYNGHPAFRLQTVGTVQTTVIYDVTAQYDYDQLVSVADTTDYEQIPLLSGNDHTPDGLFDAHRDHELRRDTANKVMLEIKQGGDGYMQVRVVVNGVVKNDGAFYDTRRTAEDMGLPQLKTNAAGDGIFIGGDGVRISRLYIAGAQIPLPVAQLLQIQAATDTPGAVYYGLRLPSPRYDLSAQLRVQDSDGEFFTVSADGVKRVLDKNGYATRSELSNLITGGPDPSLTELRDFGRDLKRLPGSDGEAWQFLDPFPENGSDVIFATLTGNGKFNNARVQEIDAAGADSLSANSIPEENNIFYENVNHPLNLGFCGGGAQLSGVALNVFGNAGGGIVSEFPPSMLIHFDYALLRALNAGETIDLLKFGDKAAIIGLNDSQGLFLNIGDTISGTFVITPMNGIFWPIHRGAPFFRIARSYPEDFHPSYFYVPSELEGKGELEFKVTVRFDDEEGNEGLGSYTFCIGRVDENGVLYQVNEDGGVGLFSDNVIFRSSGGHRDLVLNVQYVSDYNGHRTIYIHAPEGVPERIIYDISIEYSSTQTVPSPSSTQYSRQPIRGVANPIADVNPRLDAELQRRTGNTVMVELKEGSNGYIQARVMVDGVAANNGAFYDTQRTAANIGLPDLTNTGEGNGMTIGDPAVRISRIYAIKNQIPLSVRQTLKIYENIETDGTIYYTRRALNQTYKLDAQLQVRDGDGEYFTIGRPADAGVSLVLDENGYAKNFLTSPIISTDTESEANSRRIPELLDAKIIAVICAYEGEQGYYTRGSPQERIENLYTNEAMTLIYKTDYRYRISPEQYSGGFRDGVYHRNVIVGGHGISSGQRYYITVIHDRIYLENVRIPGGNPGIYAVHIYK